MNKATTLEMVVRGAQLLQKECDANAFPTTEETCLITSAILMIAMDTHKILHSLSDIEILRVVEEPKHTH